MSKGSGLHLLLGRDEVLRTLAVGFLQKKPKVSTELQWGTCSKKKNPHYKLVTNEDNSTVTVSPTCDCPLST